MKNILGFYEENKGNGNNKYPSIKTIMKRDKVVNHPKAVDYLKEGFLMIGSRSRDLDIENNIIPRDDIFTDGNWLWTSYYTYMVEIGVEKVPEEFVMQMQKKNFKAPTREEISMEKLIAVNKLYFKTKE